MEKSSHVYIYVNTKSYLNDNKECSTLIELNNDNELIQLLQCHNTNSSQKPVLCVEA